MSDGDYKNVDNTKYLRIGENKTDLNRIYNIKVGSCEHYRLLV